jgi:hypothetical protein
MLEEEYVRILISKDRNKEFHRMAETARSLDRRIFSLQNTCEHEVTKGGVHPDNSKVRTSSILGNIEAKYDYESGACWICGKEFGWYCPDSPNHICEYSQEYYQEGCIYCDQPEERK